MKRLPESYIVYRLKPFLFGKEMKKVQIIGYIFQSILLHFYDYIHTYSEKAMAAHFSTLAWKIPWIEEPGRLQSMGSLRVRYNRVTSLPLFILTHWRRKWQPIPVFLPRESQGQGSPLGCHLWGHTESDTTEVT